MSLGLIKPGMRSANLAGKRHPKTGELLVPLGYLKNGTAVWPVMGAASDDPDDPAFTGQGGQGESGQQDDDEDDDSDDESSDDEDESTKAKDDDEDKKPTRPERQAARYRTERNALRKELDDLRASLRRRDDADKPKDEILGRDLSEARSQVEQLTATNRKLVCQLAFFQANKVEWADSGDAFSLAEREGVFDDLIDEDGTVDTRELQRALSSLAKRKPHLVKSRARDEDGTDEESSSRSGSTMNGRRKGDRGTGTTREQLARRFPVLGR
jgi:hypothetical protein